jgi:hypothetical protein
MAVMPYFGMLDVKNGDSVVDFESETKVESALGKFGYLSAFAGS